MPTHPLNDFLLKVEPLLESLYQSLEFACVAVIRGADCILIAGKAGLSTERFESGAGISPVVQANELIAYQGRIEAQTIKQLIDNLRESSVIRGLPLFNVRLAEETSAVGWTIPAVFSIPQPSRWKSTFSLSGNGPNVSSLLDYSTWQKIDIQLRRSTPSFNGFDGLCGKLGLPARRNSLASSLFQLSAELPAKFELVDKEFFAENLEIDIRCLGTPDLMIEWLPQHDLEKIQHGWHLSGEGGLHHVSLPVPNGAERARLMLSFGDIDPADAMTYDVSSGLQEKSAGASENISMPHNDRWDKIKPLGEGGQGRVFLARSPARATARENAKSQIRPCIGNIGGNSDEPSASVVQRLVQAIGEHNRPETPDELGALKEFKIPSDDKEEQQRALGRLESEVRALQRVKHPAVIELRDANIGERFIVTEYHDRGTLDKHLGRFKGDALAALRAFRKLVDGVVEIHSHGAIHRDIKPENIFIAASDELVLGDFGIVFFEEGERLTKTYGERVGSHYWMAPWAYDSVRLELNRVKPPLDIYALGKVLWSMIAGRNGFPFWEYQKLDNDLERLFPNNPSMPLVNGLLARCVVREEKDCLASAIDLRSAVDDLIEQIAAYDSGRRPDGAEAWPCRICGKGKYRPLSPRSGSGPVLVLAQVPGSIPNDQHPFSIFICDDCGHAELFKAY